MKCNNYKYIGICYQLCYIRGGRKIQHLDVRANQSFKLTVTVGTKRMYPHISTSGICAQKSLDKRQKSVYA